MPLPVYHIKPSKYALHEIRKALLNFENLKTRTKEQIRRSRRVGGYGIFRGRYKKQDGTAGSKRTKENL